MDLSIFDTQQLQATYRIKAHLGCFQDIEYIAHNRMLPKRFEVENDADYISRLFDEHDEIAAADALFKFDDNVDYLQHAIIDDNNTFVAALIALGCDLTGHWDDGLALEVSPLLVAMQAENDVAFNMLLLDGRCDLTAAIDNKPEHCILLRLLNDEYKGTFEHLIDDINVAYNGFNLAEMVFHLGTQEQIHNFVALGGRFEDETGMPLLAELIADYISSPSDAKKIKLDKFKGLVQVALPQDEELSWLHSLRSSASEKHVSQLINDWGITQYIDEVVELTDGLKATIEELEDEITGAENEVMRFTQVATSSAIKCDIPALQVDISQDIIAVHYSLLPPTIKQCLVRQYATGDFELALVTNTGEEFVESLNTSQYYQAPFYSSLKFNVHVFAHLHNLSDFIHKIKLDNKNYFEPIFIRLAALLDEMLEDNMLRVEAEIDTLDLAKFVDCFPCEANKKETLLAQLQTPKKQIRSRFEILIERNEVIFIDSQSLSPESAKIHINRESDFEALNYAIYLLRQALLSPELDLDLRA